MRWKHIKEYPDYAVSDAGLVMRATYGSNTWPGKILKPQLKKDGYLQIGLWKNGKYFSRKISILVLEAFSKRPFISAEVNHKDGVKTINDFDNLEWVTHKENAQHAVRTGLWDKAGFKSTLGTKNIKAKLTEQDVLDIRRLTTINRYTPPILSMIFNISLIQIKRINNRQAWAHI